MANIAGGVVAGSALEGQKDYRMAEAQNIQNQSAQLDLDERNDAHRAYVQAMDAWAAQKKQKKAAEQAQVQPQSALGVQSPAPSQQDASGVPPEGYPVQTQWAPQGAVGVPVGSQMAVQGPATGGGIMDASPRYDTPQSTPTAGLPSATQQAAQAAPAAAPTQSSAPAQSPATPAPAPAKEDGFIQKITKALGIEPQVLSNVPRTPGAMKGLIAAQQHVEQMQKQELQQDINQMFRANATKSEPEQIAAAVQYGKEHNIPGAPDSFVAVKGEDGRVMGWKALHDGAQEGGLIPNLGHGFLDSYTRVLYGAVDRMGSIGAGIEQESALGLEREKGTQKVRAEEAKGKAIGSVQTQKDEAAMRRVQEQNKGREKVAGIGASARVQAVRERTAGDEKITKKIEVLVKQKNAITNASKDITGAVKPSPADQARLAKIEAQIAKYNKQLGGGDGGDESDTGAAGGWKEYDQ